MAGESDSSPRFNIFITEPKEHPSLEILRSVGEVRLGYRGRRYTEEELAAELADCDAVMITSRDRITRGIIEAAPRLKVIMKYGAPPEKVDLESAAERGIKVLCTPKSNPDSVAEHAIMLILAVQRQLCQVSAHLRAGGWRDKVRLGPELMGKTVGLIGLGNVGGQVAWKLRGFQVRIVASDPYITPQRAERFGVTLVDLNTVLKESDVVSLHPMVTSETRRMIGEAQLRMMKPGAILINTSRGEIVVEADLVKALEQGWISGAGIDVWDQEPLSLDNPLLHMENVIATPHVAAYTKEAMDRELTWAAEDTKRALLGEPPIHS